jgi:hypothetical protein
MIEVELKLGNGTARRGYENNPIARAVLLLDSSIHGETIIPW